MTTGALVLRDHGPPIRVNGRFGTGISLTQGLSCIRIENHLVAELVAQIQAQHERNTAQ